MRHLLNELQNEEREGKCTHSRKKKHHKLHWVIYFDNFNMNFAILHIQIYFSRSHLFFFCGCHCQHRCCRRRRQKKQKYKQIEYYHLNFYICMVWRMQIRIKQQQLSVNRLGKQMTHTQTHIYTGKPECKTIYFKVSVNVFLMVLSLSLFFFSWYEPVAQLWSCRVFCQWIHANVFEWFRLTRTVFFCILSSFLSCWQKNKHSHNFYCKCVCLFLSYSNMDYCQSRQFISVYLSTHTKKIAKEREKATMKNRKIY